MKYGIILGGNSPKSKIIFTLQKITVRIIAGVKSRTSCRNPFMSLEILSLPCEYEAGIAQWYSAGLRGDDREFESR
jgi:hypothetical protein